MDTSGLFITRKRKKWKFAHFDEWPNCFQANQASPELWKHYFETKQPLVVELGAGTADLSLKLATAHPDKNYIAIDVKADRLYTGAKQALTLGLSNIAFVRAHAYTLPRMFTPRLVDELWITFPDPFPKKRQSKHRLTHPNFLKMYATLLAKKGSIRFKTDNRELFLWSLEQFVAQGWDLRELSFDLHQSELPAEYKITTNYERRFMDNVPINYCNAAL